MTIIARGPATLYDVKGSADVPYRVVLAYDNSVEATCTCPAFFYRTSRSSMEGCKHIDGVRIQQSIQEAEDASISRPLPPGVPTDNERDAGLVGLLEDSFTRGMELGRKFGALYGKAAR